MIYHSYSQRAAYQRCARRWRDGGKEEQTEAMAIGHAGHEAIAAYLLDDQVIGAETDAAKQGKAMADTFCETFSFPSKDLFLSIEGTGIPESLRQTLYGKDMAAISLDTTFGLRGVMDLVVTSEDGTAVIVIDWKTGYPNEELHALQGACYAVLCAACWPGFPRYEFRPVYLLQPHTDYRLSYSPEDVAAAREYLLGQSHAMMANRECAPTANRYCGTCPLRDGCAAYATAVTEFSSRSLVSTLTLTDIEREDRRLAGLVKVIDAYRSELDAELTRRVTAAGLITEGPDEWYVGTKHGNRKWSVPEVATLAVTELHAGRITDAQFAACFSVVAGGIEKLKKPAPNLYLAIDRLASREEKPAICKRSAPPTEIESTTNALLQSNGMDIQATVRVDPTAASASLPVCPSADGESTGVVSQPTPMPDEGSTSRCEAHDLKLARGHGGAPPVGSEEIGIAVSSVAPRDNDEGQPQAVSDESGVKRRNQAVRASACEADEAMSPKYSSVVPAMADTEQSSAGVSKKSAESFEPAGGSSSESAGPIGAYLAAGTTPVGGVLTASNCNIGDIVRYPDSEYEGIVEGYKEPGGYLYVRFEARNCSDYVLPSDLLLVRRAAPRDYARDFAEKLDAASVEASRSAEERASRPRMRQPRRRKHACPECGKLSRPSRDRRDAWDCPACGLFIPAVTPATEEAQP